MKEEESLKNEPEASAEVEVNTEKNENVKETKANTEEKDKEEEVKQLDTEKEKKEKTGSEKGTFKNESQNADVYNLCFFFTSPFSNFALNLFSIDAFSPMEHLKGFISRET